MSTDEIKQDEVFMPQTVLPRECHESKLKWEKENRDFFHLIRDIDTGNKSCEKEILRKDFKNHQIT